MMHVTDMSEKGLETLIVHSLINEAVYSQGNPKDYDREHAIDLAKLMEFAKLTQPKAFEAFSLGEDTPKRTKFPHRLQGEIAKRGVIDVLRLGVSDGHIKLELFYGTPSMQNPKAQERYKQNIFSVTRQLQYSMDNTKFALDMAIFINGLPVITFELKNKITKQAVEDAVQQYKRDRDSRELLFHFGRCAVHFAVDDHEVRMCIHLKDKASWFLHVLQNYTPVDSYYRLIKSVENDPEFDTKRARKKLHRYVESRNYAIRQKAEIMVDHFHDEVLARHKIGGKARAVVVCSGIERAIQYCHAFCNYLTERKSPYKAMGATLTLCKTTMRQQEIQIGQFFSKIDPIVYWCETMSADSIPLLRLAFSISFQHCKAVVSL